MSATLISVLINTYNNGSFIEDAIDSALAQNFPADQIEIIVVDDGSTDDTPSRVKKYDGRIRYFRTRNGDQCSAVTFGVAQAKGDIVALLDGDDVWLPNKLSRVAQEFAKDGRTVMVYHKYAYWDSRDNSVWDPGYVTEVSGDVLADRRKLLTYSTAPTSSLAFRRDAFHPLARIPLDRAFTYDLFLTSAILFLGPVACVPEVLTRQRIHGRNRWVCGKDGPDKATLRRRIARWEAAMEITSDWLLANAPSSARPQARILLRRWRLFQDSQQFCVAPPSRIRFFLFLMDRTQLMSPTYGLKLCAINYFNSLAALVTGYKHFGALDAFWHTLEKAKDYLSSLVLGRAKSNAGDQLEM
jgi:GT2 family glycosyltransferase